MVRDPPVSRRATLRLLGGAGAAAATTGLASADGEGDDRQRYNVGYDRASGKRAARGRADSVAHEFAFDALTIEADEEAARGLQRRNDVRYVEEDGEMEALGETLPWGIDRTDADVAHSNGDTGDGVDVAIIDTGIDHDHPDLAGNLGDGKAFVTTTELGAPAWEDDNGHGTHCAGTADALDDSEGVIGVSTTAVLHAVKVPGSLGTGSTSDVARGIEYTADQGWEVASLSLGGGASSTLKEACEYAASKGVTLVAAAGNDGPCTDCVGYPAAYSECIAVSATNKDDQLADFSSQGPEVEIAAPGADVYSTYDGDSYETLSGTSMACPHVSGAAAQAIANGASSRSEVRSALKNNAEDIGLTSNEGGAGLLDVATMLGYDSSDDGTGDGGGDGGGGLLG